MCVSMHIRVGDYGSQKKATDPLEESDRLELQFQGLVIHLVWVLGPKLQFSESAANSLNN